jgi:hypothetical protein
MVTWPTGITFIISNVILVEYGKNAYCLFGGYREQGTWKFSWSEWMSAAALM